MHLPFQWHLLCRWSDCLIFYFQFTFHCFCIMAFEISPISICPPVATHRFEWFHFCPNTKPILELQVGIRQYLLVLYWFCGCNGALILFLLCFQLSLCMFGMFSLSCLSFPIPIFLCFLYLVVVMVQYICLCCIFMSDLYDWVPLFCFMILCKTKT